MKRFWLSIMAVLLITAAAVPAFAWEFSMTGQFEYRLRYFSRTGSADLWGDASIQENSALNMFDSTAAFATTGAATATAQGPNYYQTYTTGAAPVRSNYIGFAGPNIYMTGFRGAATAARPIIQDSAVATSAGVAVVRGGFSRYGTDAMFNDMKMTVHPSFKVNNAIRVHGVYTVGGFRNKYVQNSRDANGDLSPGVPPFERYYMSKTSEAAYNTAALGSWEQLRATVQWPLGTLSMGIKDFPFGTGATFAQSNRSDTFVNIIPYGPFRIIHGIWFMEGAKTGTTSYSTVPDKDTKNDIKQGLLIDYNQGPLNVGIGWIGTWNHGNRGYGLSGATEPNAWTASNLGVANSGNGVVGAVTAISGAAWAYDQIDMITVLALKYNNGRFFTNAEYAWTNVDNYYVGHYPIYSEGYHNLLEAGVLAGPAKLSLVWAQASGPVFNNGNITKRYISAPVNYQVIEPYSYLMFPIYGGGNNTYNIDGVGQLGDAMMIGGRLDYATAANLNLFGTFIYAKRLEKNGTLAGQYNSALTNSADGSVTPAAYSGTATQTWNNAGALAGGNILNAQTWKGLVTGAGGAGLNPYVDDDFLGWEAQGGFNWKLLEGLTMEFAYSYWQPGQWFNQAYRAVSSSAYGLQGQDMWMTNRSAIQSLRGQFTIDF